jgi:hypothetical protein
MCSCNSTRKFQSTDYPPLTKENIGEINGVYGHDLWDKLGHGNFETSGCLVRLTAVSERRIKGELMVRDSVLATTMIKGKIRENGYFSVNQKLLFVPIPLLFVFRRNKRDFILTRDKDIHLAYSDYGLAIILILSGGDANKGALICRRIYL